MERLRGGTDIAKRVFRGLTLRMVAVGIVLAVAIALPWGAPLRWPYVIAGFTFFALVAALLLVQSGRSLQSHYNHAVVELANLLAYAAIVSANLAVGDRFTPLVMLFLTPVMYEAVADRGRDFAAMAIGTGAVAFALTCHLLGLPLGATANYTMINTVLTIIVFQVVSFCVREMQANARVSQALAQVAATAVGTNCVSEVVDQIAAPLTVLTGADAVNVQPAHQMDLTRADVILLPSGRAVQFVGATDLTHLPAINNLLRMLDDRASSFRELETQSVTDPLTGLFNRRGLGIGERDADSGPVSIAVVDLDHFKAFNDQHGHQAGDELLRTFSSTLTAVASAEDQLVRLGGEEFCVIMRRDLGTAELMIEALRIAWRIRGQGTTFSVGITALATHEDHHEGIDRADQALYRAKREGRDRVVTTPALT